MRTFWKIIMFICVLLLGAFCHQVLQPDPNIVGQEHFLAKKSTLETIKEQVQTIPIQPGKTISARSKQISLPNRVRDVHVICDDHNRLFFVFSMGGGFLGNQGYIYTEHNITGTQVSGLPDVESYIFKKVDKHWWSYDGKYD